MVIYINESEMIERFSESLKEAASCARQMTDSELKDKPKIFVNFIACLKRSAGSSHQLSHAQMNPYWLDVRDRLEKIIEVGQSLPSFNNPNYALWLQISNSLLHLADQGNKMFLRKALPTQQVDRLLDIRLKNLPEVSQALKDSPLG